MSASACLRISLDLSDEKLAKLDAISPLVAKVTGAFLESRWGWPKRYSVLTPFIFMLTDPKVSVLDVAPLERLAEELRLRLFGTSDAGEVILLLLDADEADTARFIEMDHAGIKKAIAEPIKPTPFGGRLLKISSAADSTSGIHWRTLEREPAASSDNALGGLPHVDVGAAFRGVYFTPRQSFVGSTITAEPTPYSLIDGASRLPHNDAEEFDMACIRAGFNCLVENPSTGVLFMPICFSSLVRRSARDAYEQAFQAFPTEKKSQMAAVVYDVPRAPSFQAVTQLHDMLGRHFASIDLQIEDPGFELDKLPPRTINSVTFRLPEGDERMRLGAVRGFMKQRESFKRQRVWPAVTNVRTRAELGVCVQERTPFVTGQAVCGPLSKPVGGQHCEVGRLPFTRAV